MYTMLTNTPNQSLIVNVYVAVHFDMDLFFSIFFSN